MKRSPNGLHRIASTLMVIMGGYVVLSAMPAFACLAGRQGR